MIKEIKEMLDYSGYTIKKIATFVDTQPDTVSRWFNGKFMPTPDKLDKLAKVFKVDKTELKRILKGAKENG